MSLASLRRIFPPISATPAPPRPTALTSQPRPKRQSTDMPAMPSKKERDAEHANGKAEEDDVDVVIAHDIVKMKEEAAAEPEQRSTPNRSRGRVTKAEMRELFENVSSPLAKV